MRRRLWRCTAGAGGDCPQHSFGNSPHPIDVVGDMETALVAAFEDGPGVIVIAGTGSIAYGRDKQGRTLRAGGWGFAIGDEGSAHWIGREAVSAVLRASDRGGESPSLAAALCKAWGVGTLIDLARGGELSPAAGFLCAGARGDRKQRRSSDDRSFPGRTRAVGTGSRRDQEIVWAWR